MSIQLFFKRQIFESSVPWISIFWCPAFHTPFYSKYSHGKLDWITPDNGIFCFTLKNFISDRSCHDNSNFLQKKNWFNLVLQPIEQFMKNHICKWHFGEFDTTLISFQNKEILITQNYMNMNIELPNRQRRTKIYFKIKKLEQIIFQQQKIETKMSLNEMITRANFFHK